MYYVSKKINSIEMLQGNVEGFLGNYRAENYQQLVQDLIKVFGTMVCWMMLQLNKLDAHLESFQNNMSAYSEEKGI